MQAERLMTHQNCRRMPYSTYSGYILNSWLLDACRGEGGRTQLNEVENLTTAYMQDSCEDVTSLPCTRLPISV